MKDPVVVPTEFPQFLTEKLSSYENLEQERIKDAFTWTQQYCSADAQARDCSLEAAAILADLRLDADTIIAAILHEALEHSPVSTATPAAPANTAAIQQAVKDRFGGDVAFLVDGAARIAGISTTNKTIQEAENVRKMLFAMVSDIRIIFIKLADRLTVLRHLAPSKEAAQECLDIYAPLADRLGISWMKDELEDLALKNLNREVFARIKEIVSLKKEGAAKIP